LNAPKETKAGPQSDIENNLQAAVEHHRAMRLSEAERLYRNVLAHDPLNADALHLLGVIACQAERPQDAIGLIEKAIENAEPNAEFFNNLGNAYGALSKPKEAADCFRQAIDIVPEFIQAQINLGNALRDLERPDEAVVCFERVLTKNPCDAHALNGRGCILMDRGETAHAIASFKAALEADPNCVPALNNLGDAQQSCGNLKDAEDCFLRAISLSPKNALFYNNLGNVFSDQGRLKDAIENYRHAISLSPNLADVHHNLGNALSTQGALDEAIACYRQALELRPDHASVLAALLGLLQKRCAWEEVAALRAKLDRLTDEEVKQGKKTSEQPFLAAIRSISPQRSLQVARAWSLDCQRRIAHLSDALAQSHGEADGKIHVGYISGDFHDHATTHLAKGLFAQHDREKFKISAYSYGPDDKSSYRKAIKRGCDAFVDIRPLSPLQAATKIRQDSVHILVDLKGYTEGNRMDICALRPAPVQVSYLGFPGTSGADFFDYIVLDPIVAPEDHLKYYQEQPIYLPHSYQINDDTQKISKAPVSRADFGLPEDAFIYCCFNQSYKIDAPVFDAWMDILKRTPESVLWLFQSNPEASQALRDEAKARDIDPARLVFAERLSKERHLARLKLADLALDTPVCNGHTTTSDALWANVPVITIEGGHFASRVSQSLLAAVGLPDLVTPDLCTYRNDAVHLAENPEALAKIKKRLEDNRLTKPLFDTQRFVSDLESAYVKIWSLFRSDEKPRRIDIR
jgi:protein O-GlcNAc transferase